MVTRYGWLLALLWLLTACSTAPKVTAPSVVYTPLTQFQLQGRISVKAGESVMSGSLDWSYAAQQEALQLVAPLGAGGIAVRREGSRIWFTDPQGKVHETDRGLDGLADLLGVRLPLDSLPWWLAGAARATSVAQREYLEDGSLAALTQDGWRIEYARPQQLQGRWLPGRIIARQGEAIEIRLVVDTWRL